MNSGRTIFSQLMDFLPRRDFNRCVERYQGNRRVRSFSCMDQFLCMAFAQITGRESLRDIETCLRSMGPKLFHAGIRGKVSRSTLADANESRDWRIWADLAQVLIRKARVLYAHEDIGVELDATAYAFDSTTIDLCLSLFPWARFRKTKAAVKAHTLLDLRGAIPCFVHVTAGCVHDLKVLDVLPLEPGAFYILDRGYIDWARLHRFVEEAAFFIIRSKHGLALTRRLSRPVDKSSGLRCDQTVTLTNPQSFDLYPQQLRRIAYVDAETGKRYVFLTNSFSLSALTVARLYKLRWQVELFFKWVKQHLRIKSFFGTSENAVKTQIWIAMAVYVLVAIVRKELHLDRSLYEIHQILSISLFEKSPILLALNAFMDKSHNDPFSNQLELFTS